MHRTTLGALGATALAFALAAPAHAAAPSNDDFGDALAVTAPGDYTGTIADATAEVFEPSHAGSARRRRRRWMRPRRRWSC